jgi:hypothetical protein
MLNREKRRMDVRETNKRDERPYFFDDNICSIIAVRGKVEVCDMIGGRRIMNERG